MKTFLLLIAIALLSLSASVFDRNPQAKKEQSENDERSKLCKLFQKKAIDYKKNMRDDELARATLKSYEERAALYCKQK